MTEGSFIIRYPSFPEIKNEFHVTSKEQEAFYDIIIDAFLSRYKYEKAKSQGRESYFANKNLNDIKVYSSFLNRINSQIKDPFLRSYVMETIACLKSNNYSLTTVKQTYDTIKEWFVPGTLKGNIFRTYLAKKSTSIFVDFNGIFEKCNKVAITEDSVLFKDIKNLYKQYSDDLEKSNYQTF